MIDNEKYVRYPFFRILSPKNAIKVFFDIIIEIVEKIINIVIKVMDLFITAGRFFLFSCK